VKNLVDEGSIRDLKLSAYTSLPAIQVRMESRINYNLFIFGTPGWYLVIWQIWKCIRHVNVWFFQTRLEATNYPSFVSHLPHFFWNSFVHSSEHRNHLSLRKPPHFSNSCWLCPLHCRYEPTAWSSATLIIGNHVLRYHMYQPFRFNSKWFHHESYEAASWGASTCFGMFGL
jgi:hypothetical protein